MRVKTKEIVLYMLTLFLFSKKHENIDAKDLSKIEGLTEMNYQMQDEIVTNLSVKEIAEVVDNFEDIKSEEIAEVLKKRGFKSYTGRSYKSIMKAVIGTDEWNEEIDDLVDNTEIDSDIEEYFNKFELKAILKTIMVMESGGVMGANLNKNKNGTIDSSIWQINSCYSKSIDIERAIGDFEYGTERVVNLILREKVNTLEKMGASVNPENLFKMYNGWVPNNTYQKDAIQVYDAICKLKEEKIEIVEILHQEENIDDIFEEYEEETQYVINSEELSNESELEGAY